MTVTAPVGSVDDLVGRLRNGTTVHEATALPASDGFRAMSEFDAARGELLLADVAVLVEGRTEKLALPHVFRALRVDVDRDGISIVECGGKANLVIFARLCGATGVPFLAAVDVPDALRRVFDTATALSADAHPSGARR